MPIAVRTAIPKDPSTNQRGTLLVLFIVTYSIARTTTKIKAAGIISVSKVIGQKPCAPLYGKRTVFHFFLQLLFTIQLIVKIVAALWTFLCPINSSHSLLKKCARLWKIVIK